MVIAERIAPDLAFTLAGGSFCFTGRRCFHGACWMCQVRLSSLTLACSVSLARLRRIASPMDGITMTRTLICRFWPGLLAMAWLLSPSGVQAQCSTPIPIATDSVFIYRFNVKIGPSAFARPAGPWYSYFPVDPNLMARPQAAAFPNWPTSFPPAAASAPAQAAPRYAPGITYYQPPPSMPYGYSPGVSPASYYAPQQSMGWYPRQ